MAESDKMFAVIDTNVIVSALITSNPQSPPLQVIRSMFLGKIVPVFNQEILAEYNEVLHREKFHIASQDIEDVMKAITSYGIELGRSEVADEVFPDAKDVVFYEVKMSKDDAYLVTGNIKHFPKKPFVITPAEMVDILKEKGLL